MNRVATARGKIAFIGALACAVLFAAVAAHAQTEDQAWLNYRPLGTHIDVPAKVVPLGQSTIEQSAADEMVHGLQGIIGKGGETRNLGAGSIVLGTYAEFQKRFPTWQPFGEDRAKVLTYRDNFAAGNQLPQPVLSDLLRTGGQFAIYRNPKLGRESIFIEARDEDGVLYGVFAFLRLLASGKDLPPGGIREQPAMHIRWVDEWDNASGTVERGYGGRSIFFEDGKVRDDLAQVSEYARLLASIGINGCNVNNVNGAAPFLDPQMIAGLARVANAMRPWGVRMAISVDIASPQKIGGLKTFDPLDPQVKAWWSAKVDEIYALIPDLAGFTVKADSEGQAGPASYGRSPADAANVLANGLAPHGGVVLYRAFVYNNHLDYNDLNADRARAAYDIFHPLDGKFARNVIVQTKEGPIDFQAQEPVSPLFAGLRQTNQAMELQITQEYLGQQHHLVYIAPMWKWVLDFDLHADDRSTAVKQIIEGKSFDRPLGGMIGVADVGRDGWLGAPLAMANLYAFGRLAWNPDLSAEEIAQEWTRQTISNDPEVVATVDQMLMQSWPAYVDYTGFLGTQTLTDITGSHYGPNIESSERNGWGQWHRDDAQGIGMDRSVATGTGFIGQYPPEVAQKYNSVESCPDNLLLFFHHVPWTYKLHSGKTVIQYVYDSHYQGADEAAGLGKEWATLKGKIDPALYEDERVRLEYQAGHAIVWRDAIVQYFLKESGIPDAEGRAGHYPGRMEAEDARLTGYTIIDAHPWEDASGGKAVSCQGTASVVPQTALKESGDLAPVAPVVCSAEWTYAGKPRRYNIAVQYFDLAGGTARFTLSVNGNAVASWSADAALPSRRPNGDNSTRYTAREVDLKPGDVLRVEGTPDAADPAALDYIEIE